MLKGLQDIQADLGSPAALSSEGLRSRRELIEPADSHVPDRWDLQLHHTDGSSFSDDGAVLTARDTTLFSKEFFTVSSAYRRPEMITN